MRKTRLGEFAANFFKGSYLGIVSELVKDEIEYEYDCGYRIAVRLRLGVFFDYLPNIQRAVIQGSYLGIVSELVKDEKISVDELKELIDMIESGNK